MGAAEIRALLNFVHEVGFGVIIAISAIAIYFLVDFVLKGE